ncbi:asparagine synthase (glutamine-hydrolyzing) [Corallibacter vietnamensis]|uniref:asparagine synthase (glutamine-hydrolyzing) n=1 Tax=Corallibacter vietnamensis TaxID=904130 RepID=A0ABP7HC54_9FLAO
MCGIYGTTIKYNENQVKQKLERTSFRGPDKLGFEYFGNDKNVIFGHNRLAIIDLDARSNQPFTYQEKIHIVFNGEIYNFQSIKKELVKNGYQFKTTSDTEVICAAYLEYGNSFVSKLNGMFSFVIYDEHKQKLFGARDRMGQKPFYYYFNGHDFEFASQISSIQLFNKHLTISSKSISYYLAWGFIPDPFSIFNEVNKLKAGHTIEFDLQTKTLKQEPYWDINKEPSKFTGNYNDAKETLNNLIKDAVSLRLFADVPVGVFLSGGIDSSVISALATQTTTSKVKTFSVKFNEKGFDESTYAQQVANHLNTDHHVIQCNYSEGLDLIENFNTYYDEPFADASAIPSMLLAKYTREKVTVALSGDGGDESFIGYHRYKWMKQVSSIYKLPNTIRKLSSNIAGAMPHYRLKMIANGLKHASLEDLYVATATDVDFSWLNTQDNFLNISEKEYLKHHSKNLLERISDFDLKTYLNWDINTKVDRATMAYSLEARAPLMDYRIVEFARSLPTDFKYQGTNQKRILKDVLYKHVPKHIFDRPKAGFTMPFSEWFKNDLKDYVLSELNDDELKKIPNINHKEVSIRIKQHMNGSWNRYPLIWKLLVLKQWLNANKSYNIV